MEIKHVHKNMHCLKSIKEDDDRSQPGSKVNGDHQMPHCTKISIVTLGSASHAQYAYLMYRKSLQSLNANIILYHFDWVFSGCDVLH